VEWQDVLLVSLFHLAGFKINTYQVELAPKLVLEQGCYL
jgi:hypothetical protein